MDVVEDAPIVTRSNDPRIADKLLDEGEAFGPEGLLHIPRPGVGGDIHVVNVMRLKGPSQILGRE